MRRGVMLGKKITLGGCGTKRDHATGKILAYVFGTRKDEIFLQLKALLSPFGISHFYTDDWGHMNAIWKQKSMK